MTEALLQEAPSYTSGPEIHEHQLTPPPARPSVHAAESTDTFAGADQKKALTDEEKTWVRLWGWDNHNNPPDQVIEAAKDISTIRTLKSGEYLVHHGMMTATERDEYLQRKPGSKKTMDFFTETINGNIAPLGGRYQGGRENPPVPFYARASRFESVKLSEQAMTELKELGAGMFEMGEGSGIGMAFGSFRELMLYRTKGRQERQSYSHLKETEGKTIHHCLAPSTEVTNVQNKQSEQTVGQLEGRGENVWSTIDTHLADHERAVRNIIDAALEHGVDDIAFSPAPGGGYVVLHRLHGDLVSLSGGKISKELSEKIKTFLLMKSGANKTGESVIHDPRDGQINYRSSIGEAAIRCSFIPLNHPGESTCQISVSLRILDIKQQEISFESLGYPGDVIDELEMSLRYGAGLVAIAGPTNSGKSTGMGAALGQHFQLYGNKRKRLSVEDPIERFYKGVMQFQVNEKNPEAFQILLKAFKRHDPDVIAIGETRDSKTGEVAVDSAASGKLVMTTVHANDTFMALEVFARMIPREKLLQYLEATQLFIGQRLARQLCPHCRISSPITEPQKRLIKKYADNKGDALEDADLPARTSEQGPGCEHCNHKGTVGRVLLVEALPMTNQVKELASRLFLDGENVRAEIKRLRSRRMIDSALAQLAKGTISVDDVLN